MSISLEAEKTTANPSKTTKSNDSHTNNESNNLVANNNARSWLESLSPEECAAALSFRDGPFLTSFLEVAAATTTNKQQQQQASFSMLDGMMMSNIRALDIEDLKNMSVDEKEWEQTLARQRGDDGTGNATGNTSITATSNVADAKPTENGGGGGGGEKKNKKKNKKTKQDNQQGKIVEKEEKAGKEEEEVKEQEDGDDDDNDNINVVQEQEEANKKNNDTATETKLEEGPVVVILTTNTGFNNESVEASPAEIGSEDKAKEEADVFRIRGESIKNNNEDAVVEVDDANETAEGKEEELDTVVVVPQVGEEDRSDDDDDNNAKETEQKTTVASDDDTEKTADSSAVSSFSEAAKEIAENTIVVSSTTAQLAGDLPFVTIHPTFLKNKGTGECIRSLDNIIRSLSPSSGFLSHDFIPEEYLNNGNNSNNNKSDNSPPSVDKLCLQRVHSLMKAASNENAPVMLFLILLVRIEVAAYLAFGESKKGKGGKKKKNTGVSLPSKHHMDTLVKRIGLLEKKDDPKTLDRGVLEAIVAPLTEAGYCSLGGVDETTRTTLFSNDGDAKLQNLLVSPFPALIKVFSSADASNRPNFRNWNKAWNGTINNLLEFAKSGMLPSTKPTANSTNATKQNPSPPTPNTPAPTKVSTDPTTTDVTHSTPVAAIDADNNPSTPTTTSSNSKKKKKKKNKNKKKKNTNAHNNNNNNDTTGTNNNNNNSSSSKGGDASSSTNNHQPKSENVANELLSKEAGDSSEKSGSQPASSSASDNEAAKGDAPTSDSQIGGSTTKIADGKAINAENEKKTDDIESGAIVTSPGSFDENEAKLISSASDETASTKSESTRHDDGEEDDKKPAAKSTNKGDFTVSRVHGVGTVVVAPSTTADPSKTGSGGTEQKSEGDFKGEAATEDNHDEWETVEVKGRNNRKKSGRGNAQHASTSGGHASQNGPKKKASRSAGRKRANIRKMVKDILSSVLDNVDDEVRRRRQQEARAAKAAAIASPSPAPAPSAWKDASRPSGSTVASGNKKEKTLRDVVVGKKSVATPQPKKTPQPASKDGKGNNNGNSSNNKSPKSSQPSTRTTPNQRTNVSPSKSSKGQTPSADQNTAPTIPETVSAVSDPKRTAPRAGRDMTRSDSSSADTDDNPKPEEHATTPTQNGKTSSPEPPLPTLLNPGNVNSASSSVASSLEAPHAGHGHRHTSSSNEVDVGYHLLDVCDRLTRDMHVFMARRASALNIRRRERGALLGALQDSVSSIWAGHSHVELYGSCATMLDLPSSDLDVVVCGLDQIDATMGSASSPQHSIPGFGRSVSESISPDKMSEPQLRHSTTMPHFVPLQLNAERVMRLAAELERQPWAAHVKAIPTASVPVVKVLADPSRLPGVLPPGVIEGEEWMMQHHHAGNHSPTGDSSPLPNDFSSPDPSQGNTSPHYQQVMAPVWRGADVMNGLIQVDITFEGPEHGGIGSTEFSARVVQNVCDETGLAAESTAFVQTIMVVKELLAQRRLNEPFSGGLSSYALLLLVLAVMCERKVVREELDRVEMQRRVVAAGGGNSEISGASTEVELIRSAEKGNQAERAVQTSSIPKSDANRTRSDSKVQAMQGKSDSKGVSAPGHNWNGTNDKGDSKADGVVDNHGSKEAAKNSLQNPHVGSQVAPKTTPQPNSQGSKQAGKNATQANMHGTKQGGKNPSQGSIQGTKQGTKSPAGNAQGHGNKQAAKSPTQTTPQGNKQAKGHGGNNKVGNQGRGGNQQRGNNNVGVANQQRRGTAGGNQQQRGPNSTKGNTQNSQKGGSPNLTEQKAAKSPGNSWASIAMGKNKPGAPNGSPPGKGQEAPAKNPQPAKPSSFADAVARNTGNSKGKAAAAPSFAKAAAAVPKSKPVNGATTKGESDINKRSNLKQQNASVQREEKVKSSALPQKNNKMGSTEISPPATMDEKAVDAASVQTGKVEKDKERKIEADEKTSKFNNYSSEPVQPAMSSPQSAFPQGFNDVIEVLCSGETTPGKLLMHFLLFYGQHYDAHATAIDISGKHHREIPSQSAPYTHLSPYIQRRSAGTIDPITGMLTVDPIVVYDPLEGAENNNVARRCFLWSSVKWVFAQSYMTLSSAAERNTTPPGTPAAGTKDSAEAKSSNSNNKQSAEQAESSAWNGPYTDKGSLFDPSSPLLELLLSF